MAVWRKERAVGGCQCLKIAVMSTDFCPWSLQSSVFFLSVLQASETIQELLYPIVFSLDLVNSRLSCLFLVLVVLGQLSPLCEGKQLCLVKHLPSFPCVGFWVFFFFF